MPELGDSTPQATSAGRRPRSRAGSPGGLSLLLCVLPILLVPGCTTRIQEDYFEPSGLPSVISRPPEAPPNTAKLLWDGRELWVSAKVSEENRIVIKLSLFLSPGSGTSFNGNSIVIRTGGKREVIRPTWREWTVTDGIGSFRQVPFNARLKPQGWQETVPRSGIVDMGSYLCEVTLPGRYSNIQTFTLSLPAPRGLGPLHLSFVRKTADYRASMPM